ncbi:MAG: YcnI family protein [Candidatus Kaiserbacteria bacterium]|nr:YcnI family protein [Candidatus Kaiserbacteria bacterium]
MKNRAFIAVLLISLFPFLASAHVVVKPSSVGVASFQTFTMGVPSEKPLATVALRLVMPAGLQYVSPTVKPGWKITMKKDSAGNVTEIDWTGGRIPAGERDDFTFSAKAPPTETSLSWKAYQTYADGSIVNWDNDPAAKQPTDASGNMDFSKVGPYSVTSVVNDVVGAGNVGPRASELSTFVLAVAALAVAGIALARTRKLHHAHK